MYTGLAMNWKWVGAGVLVLTLAGSVWLNLTLREQVGALTERAQATERILEWERERSERFRGQLLAVQQEYEPVRREVQNAVQKNPEWAAGRVPGAVVDSLCNKGNCASTSGREVPTSTD